MLHEKPVRYNHPDGAGAGSGQWTGEKRRKHLGPSLQSDSGQIADTRISSSCSDAQRDQEEQADLENVIISDDDILGCLAVLSKRREMPVPGCSLDLEPQRKVYERLVLYRIRAHKLSKGGSIDKLGDETLKKELPDFVKYPVSLIQLHHDVSYYFRCLVEKEGGAIDWYFDLEYSQLADLGDYQRLVLINHEGQEYLTWEDYCSNFTTYEMDKEYVMFFEEMSNKIQWLRRYIGCKRTSDEWSKMQSRGAHQALKIAASFRYVTTDLAYTAYMEHIWSLDHDYWYREEMDRLLFEIWKRVTKKKMTFTKALEEVHYGNLVPRHKNYTLFALENSSLSNLKSKYHSCVKGTPDNAMEAVAEESIRQAVWKRPKRKMLHQYMMKKMEIAENIGLNRQT